MTKNWYMENEKAKVELEDIVGLIKTDEPFNSVEEVRKLRGREEMTKKRFTIDNENDIIEFDYNTDEYIQDFMWADGKSWDRICNRLNELFDENVQLKRKKERYKILAESRGERLDNYICTLNKFIKEHLEDESCNEAAKRVLRELSGTFVKEYDVSAENRKLRQENEQLKKRIKVLEDTIDGLTGTIAHYDIEEILND